MIYQCLHLSSETGKPVYYNKDGKPMTGVPDIVIPEEYRRFVWDTNYVYSAYMREEEEYFDDVGSVLETFPSWEQVLEQFPDSEEEYEWTENDHNLLHKALNWFTTQSAGNYKISWG